MAKPRQNWVHDVCFNPASGYGDDLRSLSLTCWPSQTSISLNDPAQKHFLRGSGPRRSRRGDNKSRPSTQVLISLHFTSRFGILVLRFTSSVMHCKHWLMASPTSPSATRPPPTPITVKNVSQRLMSHTSRRDHRPAETPDSPSTYESNINDLTTRRESNESTESHESTGRKPSIIPTKSAWRTYFLQEIAKDKWLEAQLMLVCSHRSRPRSGSANTSIDDYHHRHHRCCHVHHIQSLRYKANREHTVHRHIRLRSPDARIRGGTECGDVNRHV